MEGAKNGTTITQKSLKTDWKTIWILKSDHLMLRMYRAKYKITMTSVLHMLFGVAGKCLEEQHVQEITHLKKQLSHLARAVLVYRAKYGDISPKKEE